MLASPMRSQVSSPNRGGEAYCAYLRAQRPESPTSELRKQVAGAMLSVMPSTRPSTSKRPKLSLQTAIPASPSGQTPNHRLTRTTNTDSPTTRNTYTNSFDPPPPAPSSTIRPQVQSLPSLTTTTTTSSSSSSTPSSSNSTRSRPHSPSPISTPYTLPLGTHSILRNSPLPRRHLSATSARAPKRMFPPIKRVAFCETPPEIIPTSSDAVEEESSSSSSEEASRSERERTEEEHEERRALIEVEDGHSSAAGARRPKRRREWIWRPVDDDVLCGHGGGGDSEAGGRSQGG